MKKTKGKEQSKSVKKENKRNRTRFFFFLCLGIIILGSAALIWIYPKMFMPQTSVTQENLSYVMHANAQEMRSGEELILTIEYENTSVVDMVDARIQLEVPPGFVVKDVQPSRIQYHKGSQTLLLGPIAARQKKQVQIKGILFGPLHTQQFIKSTIFARFVTQSEFVSLQTQLPVQITDALLEMNIEVAPSFPIQSLQPFQISFLNMYSGDDVNIAVAYKKPTQIEFRNVNVSQTENQFLLLSDQETQRVQGDIFINANTPVNQDIVFELYVISSGTQFLQAQKTVSFQGHDTGARFLFSVNEHLANASEVSVSLGKQNSFQLLIQNKGKNAISDVQVKLPINVHLFDMENATKDAFSYQSAILTFDQKTDSRLKEIAPGASVALMFSLPAFEQIKHELVFQNVRDEIPMTVDISYVTQGKLVRTASPDMVMKVNSNLSMDIRVKPTHLDDTYDVEISVKNPLNWTQDTMVLVHIPASHVIQTFQTGKGDVVLVGQELTWNLGMVSPGNQSYILTLQIQTQDNVFLFDRVQLQAIDMHTKQKIQVKKDAMAIDSFMKIE